MGYADYQGPALHHSGDSELICGVQDEDEQDADAGLVLRPSQRMMRLVGISMHELAGLVILHQDDAGDARRDHWTTPKQETNTTAARFMQDQRTAGDIA